MLEVVEPSRKKRERELDALLEEFTITRLRKSPSIALSGGERRRVEIARALAAAFDVVGAANERVQHAAPWAADTPVHVVHAAVYDTVETLRIVGVLLAPFMPVPMARLLDLVGAAPHERTWAALGGLRTHIPLRTAPGKIAPLFPRVAA